MLLPHDSSCSPGRVCVSRGALVDRRAIAGAARRGASRVRRAAGRRARDDAVVVVRPGDHRGADCARPRGDEARRPRRRRDPAGLSARARRPRTASSTSASCPTTSSTLLRAANAAGRHARPASRPHARQRVAVWRAHRRHQGRRQPAAPRQDRRRARGAARGAAGDDDRRDVDWRVCRTRRQHAGDAARRCSRSHGPTDADCRDACRPRRTRGRCGSSSPDGPGCR